jgi:hypothetical protein
MTFSIFTSPCTNPLAWSAPSAARTLAITGRIFATGAGPSWSSERAVFPGIQFVARYTRPSALPTSRIFGKAGCSTVRISRCAAR